MNEVFRLFGSIGLHTEDVEQGLDGVRDHANDTAKGLPEGFKNAVKVIGGLFAVGKIIDFGKDTLQANADAEAIRSQYTQVFGNLTGEADKMSVDMAKQFGMIPEQLQPGMVKFESMFKGVGISAEDALGMTKDATTASADAAAFANVSYESAQGSIQSFILGNYEAGDAIGIQANDNAIAQYAIQQGAVTTTAEWQKMGDAQKEQMRLGFIKHQQELSGVTGQAGRESQSYNVVMDKLKATWQKFLSEVGSTILPTAIKVMQGAIPVVTDLIKKFQDMVKWVKENQEKVKAVALAVTVMIATFKTIQTVTAIVNGVKMAIIAWKTATEGMTVAQKLLNVAMSANVIGIIVAVIAGLVAGFIYAYKTSETFRNTVNNAFNSMKAVAMNVFKAIGDFLKQCWEVIKSVGTSIGNFFKGLWDGIGQATKLVWDAIKFIITTYIKLWLTIITGFVNGVKAVWNGLLNVTKTVFNGIKTAVTAVWNGIKTVSIAVWNAIVNTIKGIITGWANVISSVFNGIKSVITGVWNGIKSVTLSVWNAIASAVTGKINAMKSGVSNVFNNIKSVITGVWNGIRSVTSSVWNGIQSHINAVINNMRTIVNNGINFIKGLFNFRISFPHIPMPHFSVSGSMNPLKWIDEGVPRLGVEFYAKGGIMNGATAFGMNGNNMMVGGEAGEEAVLPLTRENLGMIGERIAMAWNGQNDSTIIVQAIKDMTATIVQAVKQHKDVYLDGNKLTAQIENIMMKGANL